MRRGELLPSSTEVRLVCLRQVAGAVQVELRTCQPSSSCPSCGTASSRVHSRYSRKLMDLPWQGLPVSILLRARKFFCLHKQCTTRIFTEQLPGTVKRYARRSCRSSESLRWLTLALGGRAGSRLARRLGLLAGRTALLRELRQKSPPSSCAPRVLGIDEWAWKKGIGTGPFCAISNAAR
ncbi:transposase family protein [Terriglobus sp.]|uniref:transposase family protein n=1 Tax=Terriglobus sp. TaxID=1889013 RepID=UPI003B00F627